MLLVADSLNAIPEFDVSSRSIRDRFKTLSKKVKSKIARQQRESGGGEEELTEVEALVEELNEINEESEKKNEDQMEAKKKMIEAEKKQAIEMRERALERLGESRKRNKGNDEEGENETKKEAATSKRRRSADTLDFLREKVEQEQQIKERDLEERREDRKHMEAIQKEQNEQFR